MSIIVERIVEHLYALEALPSRIFLVGLPACGKSRNGKRLAKAIDFDFIDADLYIEQAENISIQEIFKHIGEEYFRELEKKYLKSFYNKSKIVVGTGGGMPCFHNNMEWMNEFGYTIWLDRPIKEIVERLALKPEKRPMTRGKSRAEIEELVKALLEKRKGFYGKAKKII